MWITSTPIWVEFTKVKEYGRRKSGSRSGGIPGQVQRKTETETNWDKEPQTRVMDKFGEFLNPACKESQLGPWVLMGERSAPGSTKK